jgi:dipeptidyl-peptidase-4
MIRKLVILCLFVPFIATAQKKQITVEDIYKNQTFSSQNEFVPADFGQKKADLPFRLEDVKDENGRAFGKQIDVITSKDYPNTVILRKDAELIYRRSQKAIVYYYDVLGNKVTRISNDKIMYPTLSPDGNRIAYVKNNNLYLFDIATKTSRPITTDGEWNKIINGNADWVYEEEFSVTRAFQWSPKGDYLAYYRFDETNVREYEFTQYDSGYNKQYSYKYPKAGEENSKIEIHIYDVANNKDVKAQYENGDIYIPRIKWTTQDNQLVVFWLNRHQDDLKLLLTNPVTGASAPLYEEKNKYYVEITDDWWFLKDGKSFLFASEMDGFNHLYMYGFDGKSKNQLTHGKYDITAVNGVDEVNKRVFYTMAYPRPMDRNLFVTDFSGKKTTQLTQGEATHKVELNSDFTQFYDYRSDVNTPTVVTLNSINEDKKKNINVAVVRTVNESQKLKNRLSEYDISKTEFIRVPNRHGDTLNGWMLKPPAFDPAKKYPVLFCNYGGPGSQKVANSYGSVSLWHQLLAERGFIVVCVDNTGTGFRGEEFKKKTYLQLGKLEIEDQIDAAKYIGNMSFVDKAKIGHWGWSYGGFMSSLAITKGADVFSATVAVAPVTSWKYYDNVYTERFMRTPQENPSGYAENSPVNFTNMIKGKFLLIHGLADDNVHFQNSAQMITALVKSNIDFESAYYPNKNHGISGGVDNTSVHLWNKMTNWIQVNLGNENTQPVGGAPKQKAF